MSRSEEILYSAADSVLRLAQFRSVIESGPCDAVLLVAGVDGRENTGCASALNYLLLGRSGPSLRDGTLANEDIEEVMLVVHRGGVILYATPPVVRRLVSLTATWAGVEVLCMDEKTFRDQDLFEEHKIAAFKQMVKPFATIGIPLEGADPKKIVEKWPIVQSFALDARGQRRFFTMEHQVVDVSARLETIYGMLDSQALSTSVLTNLEMFSHHWNTTLSNVDTFLNSAKPPAEGFQEFAREPLRTYFEYATLQTSGANQDGSKHGVKPPQVLFGAESNDGGNKAASSNSPPLHFLVDCHDPQGPLWCARTYFLCTGHSLTTSDAFEGFAGLKASSDVLENPRSKAMTEDVRLLMAAYLVLIHAVQQMLEQLRSGALKTGPRKYFESLVQDTINRLGVDALKHIDLTGKVHGIVRCPQHIPLLNTNGASSSPVGSSGGPSLVHIGLRFSDLCGQDSNCLGAVSFGETVVCAANGERMLNLTSLIPRLETWAATPTEMQLQTHNRKLLQSIQQLNVDKPLAERNIQMPQLGALIADWADDSGFLFGVPSPVGGKYLLPGNTGLAFQYGLVLSHKRLGLFMPLQWGPGKSTIESVTIHDPAQLNAPIVLAIQYKRAFYCPMFLPDMLQATEVGGKDLGRIMICFNLHSQSKRTFLADVLPQWKRTWEEMLIAFTVVAELPASDLEQCYYISEHIADMNRRVTMREDEYSESTAAIATSVIGTIRSSMVRLSAQFPEMQQMCSVLRQDLAASLIQPTSAERWHPVPVRPTNDCADKSVVSVHLLHGVPGSGKHRLAQGIAQYLRSHTSGGANTVVHIFANTMQEGIVFNEKLFATKIRRALEGSSPDKKVHLLIVTPGYTSAPFMVYHINTIISDLNTQRVFPAPLKLESSVAVLSTDNFFSDHMSKPPYPPLPHILDQCAQGFVTTVLIEAPSSTVMVSSVERLVLECNPRCTVVYSRVALIAQMGLGLGPAGSEDEMIAECALHSIQMREARIAAIPDAFLKPFDSRKLSSLYLTLRAFPISQYLLTERMNKITDPKQSEIIILAAKLYVEGYARELRLINAKAYRSFLSRPSSVSEVRQEQSFFIIGRDLNETEMIAKLRQSLTSTQSVMKSILNIEGKGEFTPKVRRPKLTRDSLVKEDIEYILSLHRETPLPDGCFHDGVYYIDWEGKRSKIRPDSEELISIWIEEQNKKIEKEDGSLPAASAE